MEISSGIQIKGLSLFIPEKKILIISDIHIGYEGELAKQGVFLPKFHYKDMIDSLGKIILRTNPKSIIVTGDVKHSFAGISGQEWRETLQFMDFLTGHAKKLVFIKGNHDINL